jgi:uncharacterized protein YndB with AHSA1/START domain
MSNTTLRKTIMLAAPRETVWEYLTQPELLAKWFHAPKSPLVESGPLEMFGATSGDKVIWGDVRVARKPEYLEYTFTVAPMGDAVSVVKWTLDALEGGTRLSLEHEGLPVGAEAFGLAVALDKGWDEHMGKMRDDINT